MKKLLIIIFIDMVSIVKFYIIRLCKLIIQLTLSMQMLTQVVNVGEFEEYTLFRWH